MDILASLTAALSQSSSLLGGLLSQINATAGAGADSLQNNLFSDLVSQTDATQNNGASPFAFFPAQTTSFTPSSSFSSASGDATDTTGAEPTAAQAIQAIGDITKILHSVLNILQQRNNAPASNGNNQTASAQTPSQTQNADTQDAAQNTQQNTDSDNAHAAQNAAATTTQTAPQTDNTNTGDTNSSPAETPQQLAEIVAELLMMMQILMQRLQQTQIAAATGGVAQTANAAATANFVQNAGITNTANDSTGATGTAGTTPFDKAWAEIQALLASASDTQSNTETGATQITAANDLATGSLFSMLKKIERDALAFTDVVAGNAASETNATGNAAASTATATSATNILAQLTQIESTLKNALSVLQPKAQTQNAAAENNTPPKNLSVPATSSDVSGQNSAAANSSADPSQNQFDAAAPVPQTPANPASNQTSATAQLAAALADGTKQNDQNAGSDLLSGGNRFSFNANANTNGAFNPALATEGSQVTGTYNFASTLSAFRADNGGALGLPGVVDQVILQMNRSVKSGNDQMSVQLQPGDLGKITVKLDFGSDGKVQGTVTADNPKTLDMLQKDSRSLERALQDAGLRADPGSLQFSLGGGQGNSNNAQASADGNNAGAAANGTLDANDVDSGLVDIGALAETYYITPTGVNIRV